MSFGTSVATLGLLAVSTIGTKITRVDLSNGAGAGNVTFSAYSGASFSGGVSVTPFPMRAGAPAASATSKTSATVSGTQRILSIVSVAASGSASYQPPFDLILAAGSAMWVSFSASAVGIVIYFEELHLARSF